MGIKVLMVTEGNCCKGGGIKMPRVTEWDCCKEGGLRNATWLFETIICPSIYGKFSYMLGNWASGSGFESSSSIHTPTGLTKFLALYIIKSELWSSIKKMICLWWILTKILPSMAIWFRSAVIFLVRVTGVLLVLPNHNWLN